MQYQFPAFIDRRMNTFAPPMQYTRHTVAEKDIRAFLELHDTYERRREQLRGHLLGAGKTPAHLPQEAWLFAARKHLGQSYPGTDLPYLVHIGAVLLNLVPALERAPLLDADLARCCAILHDTVEDTKTTHDEIEAQFGKRIAAGVAALTKDKQKGPRAMEDSLQRIQTQPREIWLVKLADRAANLGTPPAHWSREKCLAYAAEGETILNTLGTASAELAARLAERIAAWRGHRA
jgi:(p)ppGpp synthase/HD superfamily hydrolase